MIRQRIAALIADGSQGDFDTLALEAFAFQFERLPDYRALCERRGRTPETVTRWDDVPMVPTLAFKSLELASDEPLEVFRSSGTGAAGRSVHRHPYPDLYRATIDAAFPAAALPGRGASRLPILSLVPSRELRPDSSLSFMVDHVLRRWGDPASGYAIGARGVDARRLRAWLAARQRGGRPVLVLATTLALEQAIGALDRLDLRFRLPAGSLLFETGGAKGRTRQVAPDELARRVELVLGIATHQTVREYGMTELTSQLYTGTLSGGDGDLYLAPSWVRVRVLDAATLEPLPRGRTGIVAIFDLANVGSALHVLTEDVGALLEGGLRLDGRARDAELRGCSLAAEELAAP